MKNKKIKTKRKVYKPKTFKIKKYAQDFNEQIKKERNKDNN